MVLDAKLEVRVAWWLEFYLHGLLFFAVMFNLEPNWEKVYDKVARAIRFRFVGNKRWHRIVD